MDPLTIGTDIATMIVGVPVLTAGVVWLLRRRDARTQLKAATKLRSWHGYVAPENAYASYVRVADGTDVTAGRIVVEVLDQRDGKPDAMLAEGMRRIIARDGMISSVPTPEEYAFLRQLRTERGYGRGELIR
jgi:hypothetical protein